MDKLSSNSPGAHYESRRASKISKRPSKILRLHRESKMSAKISSIKEEEIPKEMEASCVNYREKITNMFFDSFYSPTVIEKVSIKAEELEESLSSLDTEPSLSDNMLDSYTSLVDERCSITSKELSQKQSSRSNQSNQSNHSMEVNSNISCLSQCMCCWRVTFRNGNMYEGQLNDLIMHGKGIYYWTDGTLYKGEFRNGYAHGQGRLVLPDLSTYDGEFRMGFFDGHGKLNIKSSPILFNGQWKLSQRTGKGWCFYNTDNWYEGDWLNNQKHGSGYRYYPNGDKYQGNWEKDKICGQGCMMWHNNDYYTGEWKDGYQYGYGEYIWNVIPHDSFIFTNYNWYKGSWSNGKRSGIGIMNFGHESGAKLAGSWCNNKKDGPGIMVCGNGMLLEKNPLFTDDKPSVYMKENVSRFSDGDNLKESTSSRFNTISQQLLLKKEPMKNLDAKSLSNITKSGANINMKQYIKLLDQKSANDSPLKIPIHNVIHEVDINYFIEEFIRKPYTHTSNKKTRNDMSIIEIERMVKNMADGRNDSFLSPSCINYLPSNMDFEMQQDLVKSASEQSLLNVNEVKNLIINYLPQLRNIYKMYATVCAKPDEALRCEPILIRMFLWQLYRDIGVTDKGGVSIIEIDEVLYDNPTSCLETIHCPWEPIYFWQFVQSLVGIACIMYNAENHMYYTPSTGFMYYMFKNFLDHQLLPNAGIYQGNCLRSLKDLAPVDAMYKLYKDIGEPHTIEKFLKSTCLKQEQTIPCYKLIHNENHYEPIDPKGFNVTILNNEPSYYAEPLQTRPLNERSQMHYQGLYIFSKLGRKKIIQCLAKICPQVMSGSIKACQWQYRLSFIEFYEAVLLLTFEKVEFDRLSMLEDLIRSPSITEKASREGSRMSTHSTKRKKSRK